MDVFTAVNLFVGHATGIILFVLFVWLVFSEAIRPRSLARFRVRRQRHHFGPVNSEPIPTLNLNPEP